MAPASGSAPIEGPRQELSAEEAGSGKNPTNIGVVQGSAEAIEVVGGTSNKEAGAEASEEAIPAVSADAPLDEDEIDATPEACAEHVDDEHDHLDKPAPNQPAAPVSAVPAVDTHELNADRCEESRPVLSRSGRKPRKTDQAKTSVQRHYPEGVPEDEPLKVVRTKTGLTEKEISDSQLLRVLDRKR